MSLVYPKAKLLVMQPPKTGSQWVKAAVVATLGSRPKQVPPSVGFDRRHAGYGETRKHFPGLDNMFCLTTVRRPDKWLRSYWAMRTSKRNWQDNFPYSSPVKLDANCRSGNFEDFIVKYLQHCPGLFSVLFSDYVPDRPLVFVCRQESLRGDFKRGIKAWRNTILEGQLNASDMVPNKNKSSSKVKDRAVISDELIVKIFNAEKEFMLKYYPEQYKEYCS